MSYRSLDPVKDNDINEAKDRAKFFRDLDPFPSIPPALLSSEHISDYVRVTAMLHPFPTGAGRLKPASYEAYPKRFIRWDENGKRLVREIGDCEKPYVLPENSITFVQIESNIRLPNYIALRFNLRIKHVHRGLLLGTGPIVDPGFHGDLLIPLHNLTSEPYQIDFNEGIIWIEFTKTTHNPEKWPSRHSKFTQIDPKKTDLDFYSYFERANKSNPIQSSIPAFIKDANKRSQDAQRDARRARRTIGLFAGIGVLAIAGTVLATALSLHSYFQQMNGNIVAVNALVSSVTTESTDAVEIARGTARENKVLEKQLEETRAEIEEIRKSLEEMRAALDQQRSRGDKPAEK